MKIGNTYFNLDEVAKLNQKEFKSLYRGKLNTDIDLTWKRLQSKIKSPSSRKTK